MTDPATEHFGTEPGKALHFDFYVERSDGLKIDPLAAYELQGKIINLLRGLNLGFDGGAALGNWDGKMGFVPTK